MWSYPRKRQMMKRENKRNGMHKARFPGGIRRDQLPDRYRSNDALESLPEPLPVSTCHLLCLRH